MASYRNLLQHEKSRFESPAKVFAKLKSRVQKEAVRAREPQCNVREKHGADLNSPRRRDEHRENHRLGSYRHEVQPLTLSPISTPQKTFGYSLSNISWKPVEEMPPESEHAFSSRMGHTPTKRAFLESTAVCQPPSLVHREHVHTEPPQIRDFDGFNVSCRTPVKNLAAGSECVRGVFEQDRLMSPATMFSPMGKRLRKRKWEQQETGKLSCNPKKLNKDVLNQPKHRTTALTDDNFHNNTGMEDMGDVGGIPANESEINWAAQEAMFPSPRSMPMKRCGVLLFPMMSPAKMFAYMKEREKKREHQEVPEVVQSTRELFNGGTHIRQARDSPLFASRNTTEQEDTAFRGASESAASVSCYTEGSADSPSARSEVGLIPAAPPQPVLLEDPLVLNSPQISVPKKHKAVFKRSNWPQHTEFPNESVIYLSNWFLRRNHKGLFVDGIHREDNIPWNSNVIVDRVSKSVLKTISGRVYILVGKMNLGLASEFPNWLLKKFLNGFPTNWKSLYKKFLSESNEETERNSERTANTPKTKSDSSNLSVKQHRQKPFKTPDSCPPLSAVKVSRSGRTIKPPLEYWKGGRVILDAHMNVTILECYNTSICTPEVTKTVSARKSQKPAHVFLRCSKGRKQNEPACNAEASVPITKAKARKTDGAKANHNEKPSKQPKSSVETVSSPEVWSGRTTRSRERRASMEKHLWTHDTNRHPRSSGKQTDSESSEPPAGSNATSQPVSSEDDFSQRKKQGKGVNKTRDGKCRNKSMPIHVSASSQSSETPGESGNELKRRTRPRKSKDDNAAQTLPKHKPNKRTKKSPPTKPLPKSSHCSKTQEANKCYTVTPKDQEEDEDDWTEAELMKLQEAVSYYPKHMSSYWAKVAKMVGTRSAEECHGQHTSQGISLTPVKKAGKPRKEKMEAPKDPVTDLPVISARVGTLKRKQQLRQFLETMPREDVDDVFSSAQMQNKRFEIPSMCMSEDHEFSMTDFEPQTPMSRVYPEVKTPQCLHITPGMMDCPDRDSDDKYVYQLQKRMKKKQFNVCKQAQPSKTFTPTPSVKRTMRRCVNAENDNFVVWEMFPGNNAAHSDSGEEDFYFSDTN